MFRAVFKNIKLTKLHKKAVEYVEKKEYEKAIANILEILDEVPDHAITWKNLGTVYYESQNYEKALESFKKAITHDPRFTDAKFCQATTLMVLGKLSEARSVFESAVKEKPDFMQGWIHLAKLFWHLGEHQKAIETFQKVLPPECEKAPSFRAVMNRT